ncbi:hypothetical protein Q3G72_002275 [Acer saccharum]|nr:hypothetical protein Q3G72_002275 [Acer saccharum]
MARNGHGWLLLCNGAAASFNVNNGYTRAVTTGAYSNCGSTSFHNLRSYLVIDDGICFANISNRLLLCNGAAASFNVNNGYTRAVTTGAYSNCGSTRFHNLQSDLVIDDGICFANISNILLFCNGAAAFFNVNNGYTRAVTTGAFSNCSLYSFPLFPSHPL